MKWYTYRTAARVTGRSIRTLREWRQAGMPAKVDPETRELLIAESDLFEWWRRANRRNPVMIQRVRENLQVEAPDGGKLRWPQKWPRSGTTALLDPLKEWISWEAGAELASLAGDVEVSVSILRLAHRWLSAPGRPSPRVLRLSDTESRVWAPDCAAAGARLPTWALSLDGWAQTGIPTLEVREDELRAHRWPLGVAPAREPED